MNDLRATILTRLAASTKERPVTLDDLREFTADVCTDLDELDDALDALQDKHIINTVSGMSDGKSYRCFWLTGAKAPVSVWKLVEPQRWPLPLVASPVTAKVQPRTSIPAKQPQEQTMPSPSELRTTLLDIIGKQPCITRPELIKRAIAKVPNSTEKQINKTLANLFHAAKLIDKTGTRDLAAFKLKKRLVDDFAVSVRSAPKGKKSTAKPARPKKSKPDTGIATVPAATLPAKLNGHVDFAFNLGGSFSIRKNGQAILLTPNEALDLMQFGSQQVAMINQIKGEAA